MSTPTTYYKLNEKATMFYCPITRLKVLTTAPGKIQGDFSKKIQTALNNGHLIKIREDEYNELIEDYDAAIKKAKEALAKKGKKEEPKKEVVIGIVPEPEPEEVIEEPEDEDEDEDEDDEEPKKALKKMNKAELEDEVEDLEDIEDSKVAEVMKWSKKNIVQFIEEYDPDEDSGADE